MFTPGPIELETDTFRMYTPLAAAGLERMIWSMKALKFGLAMSISRPLRLLLSQVIYMKTIFCGPQA